MSGLSLTLLLLNLPAKAQSYTPRYILPGTIRIWGDPAMASLVEAWQTRFRNYHPEVTFSTQLLGTDTAMGPLYTNTGDLALLGREPNQTESDGFLHSLLYTPVQLRLVTGSCATPEKSPAPVFLVSAQNPLTSLTLQQARQAIGYTTPPARTWGDLGATGSWASRPLHVYTFDLESGTGLYLLAALQGPGKKMNWPVVREFHDRENPDGSVTTAARQTAEALAQDPDGLAVSTLRHAAGLKVLALDGIVPAPATIADTTYPLARRTYALINHPPGQPSPQPVTEFLRFVFSPEGQAVAAAQRSGFLPLTPTEAARQLELLTK